MLIGDLGTYATFMMDFFIGKHLARVTILIKLQSSTCNFFVLAKMRIIEKKFHWLNDWNIL